jgi:hypothetical protein
MTGEVRDSSGAVVPDAKVTATQTEKQLVRVTTTAGDGTFDFPSLLVGPYTVKVEKPGFTTYEQTGILLTVAQAATIPVTLQVGMAQQTISVTAAPTMVDTTTSTLSRLVGDQQVEALPLNGRNPSALVYLSAGSFDPTQNVPVAGTNPTLQAGQNHPREIAPVINGVRGDGVYFSLDGANNIDTYQVTGGPFPNPDAVQEFRVVTSTYGAEYVSAPGGAVNIVTKSGTNAFHGDVWEFVRNGDMNARNFFAAQSDILKRNQFGVAAGGPVIKDKLFIFGSFEAMRIVNTAEGLSAFVPTAAERAGDFSAISTQLKNPATGAAYTGNQILTTQFDPVSVGLLKYIPLPTGPNGLFQFSQPQNQTDNQGVLRIDYARGKHLFTARYFIDDFLQPAVGIQNGDIVPATTGTAARWQNMMLGDTYTKSSNFLNDFRIAFMRSGILANGAVHSVSLVGLGEKDVPQPYFPSIQSVSVSGGFGIGPGNYNDFPRDTWSLSDHADILRGRHDISFGIDLQYLRMKVLTDAGQNGEAFFTGSQSGNAFSDYLLGYLNQWEQADGILVRPRGHLFGFYGQDKIRVTNRLTLTAGLRWDPYFPFTALYGRVNCFVPGQQSQVYVNAPTGALFPGDPGCSSSGTNSNLSTFQPRIGLAYRLDPQGKTVLRAGYGMYSMQFPFSSFVQDGSAQPYTRSYSVFSSGTLSDPWAFYPGGSPFVGSYELNDAPRPKNVQFQPPVLVSSFSNSFQLPDVQQWNFSVERSLTPSTSVEASYVGTKGTHMLINADLNPAIFGPGATAANEQARRRYANIAQSYQLEDEGNSIYNGFEVHVRHRAKGGVTVDSALTLSKAIDYLSSNGNSSLPTSLNTIPVYTDPKMRRALADFDQSHVWVSSFVWAVPYASKTNMAMKELTSGWQFSGLFTVDAGQPFSVVSPPGVSLSGTGFFVESADAVPGVPRTLNPDRPRGQLVQEYFNPAAFTTAATGTFGNTGRNILRAPGLTDLDFAAVKYFPIREPYRLELRGEFFNLTNTPQFLLSGWNSGFSNTLAIPGNPALGRILGARAPRILQLALKFYW